LDFVIVLGPRGDGPLPDNVSAWNDLHLHIRVQAEHSLLFSSQQLGFYGMPLPLSHIPGLLFDRSHGMALFISYHAIFQCYIFPGNDGAAGPDADLFVLNIFDYEIPSRAAFLAQFSSRAFVVRPTYLEAFRAGERLV
jgi:hypothetical protein